MRRTALSVTAVMAVMVVGASFLAQGGTAPDTGAVTDSGASVVPLVAASVPSATFSPMKQVAIADSTRVIVPQAPTVPRVSRQSQSSEVAVPPVVMGPVAVEPLPEQTDFAAEATTTLADATAPQQPWDKLEKFSTPAEVPLPGTGCVPSPTGSVGSAPSKRSAKGVAGTTSADLASFADQYNAIRIAHCLPTISYSRFRYDSCMEARLFWMAESPSPNPLDAWGHIGSTRVDGVPSTGCDGNLAGGSDNTGATVATKWWDSHDHRASLYRPKKKTKASVSNVCIAFAMTHGGIDEPTSFVRAAARWYKC